jgi:hypothetical protein
MINNVTTEAPQAQQDPAPVTPATSHRSDVSRRGEVVRAKHPSGRIDEFEVVSTWTCSLTGRLMLSLMRLGGGFSFDVPADETTEAPKPVYGHPLDEVHRVDALDCTAPAAHRVGDRLVCTAHRLEVLHAYWESDSNLVLNEVDETAGYRCGETYPAVWR